METNDAYGRVLPTFRDVCNEMIETNIRKNADYGGAYSDLFKEFGDMAAIVPLQTKLNRIKNIVSKGGEVNNESLQDSVLDLGCYAVMYLVELKARENDSYN